MKNHTETLLALADEIIAADATYKAEKASSTATQRSIEEAWANYRSIAAINGAEVAYELKRYAAEIRYFESLKS